MIEYRFLRSNDVVPSDAVGEEGGGGVAQCMTLDARNQGGLDVAAHLQVGVNLDPGAVAADPARVVAVAAAGPRGGEGAGTGEGMK